MKRLFVTFTCLLLSFGVMSQEQNSMLVFLKDGTQLTFYIETSPRITFSDKNLKVVSTVTTAEIARENILRFEFASTPFLSVDKVSCNNDFSIEGNFVVVNSLAPNAQVQVYTINGSLIFTSSADSNGIAGLQFSDYPSGIYIIRYNDNSIKFIKK